MTGFNNGKLSIGLYEKSISDGLSWEKRLSMTRDAGYNFMEISIDKTDERLGRLKWDIAKINKISEPAYPYPHWFKKSIWEKDGIRV